MEVFFRPSRTITLVIGLCSRVHHLDAETFLNENPLEVNSFILAILVQVINLDTEYLNQWYIQANEYTITDTSLCLSNLVWKYNVNVKFTI